MIKHKVLQTRIYRYLYRYQSCFGELFSIDSGLSYLNNKIAKGFEFVLDIGIILIDLQKAFDTVNHNILITKTEFIEFSEELTK